MTAEAVAHTLVGHAGPWTEEEYLALPEELGRVELLDGSLLMSPSPAASHQRLVRQLGYAFDRAAPDDAEVLEAINVRVRKGRILIPDVAVVRRPGLDLTVYDADDVTLAVEVTSPLNAAVDRVFKTDAYAKAGIPHYVLVDLDGASREVAATAYGLTPTGLYAELARSDSTGRLSLTQPFDVSIDLSAALSATRYPR